MSPPDDSTPVTAVPMPVQPGADVLASYPLIEQMFSRHGCTEVRADDVDAFLARPGHALLVFTEDPMRFKETLDLAVIVPQLQRAMGARRLVAEQAEIDLPSGPCHVHGDQDQLAAAMLAAVEFADGLARGGSRVVVRLRKHDHALSLTLQAAGPGLADWRLPQSFEPYYPHRLLQGYGHGLQLFLLQAVVLCHRGQAVARRTDRDAIAIECALPTLD